MSARAYFGRWIIGVRHPSRASLWFLGMACASFVLVMTLVAYPAWMRAEARSAESGRLLARASQLAMLEAERDQLRRDLASTRQDCAHVLRTIPTEEEQGSQMGALMRTLAIGAGTDVQNQTIVAGEPIPALLRESRYRAIPLTVEMQASFSRVMEILARAEGEKRLVRPIRIEITRPQERSGAGSDREGATQSAFVEAKLELDAVYAKAEEAGAPATKESP